MILEIGMAIVLPGVVYLASAAALGIPVMLLAGGYWWKPGLAGYLVCLACLYILHAVPWNEHKAFLRDMRRVHPGMSATEVERLLEKYAKETAADPTGTYPAKAQVFEAVKAEGGGGIEYASAGDIPNGRDMSGCAIYHHGGPGHERERCVIRFQDDRVVSVEILRD